MKDSPVDSIVLAVVCGGASIAAWQWQHITQQRQPPAVASEHWEHVRDLFPAPEAFRLPSETAPEALQGVVRANPFSRGRRHVPQPATGTPAGAPEKPLPPQFAFKGRVVMGSKQRGVLEDRRKKKTHLVQVGQEIEGFTVVEIAEDHVVLSNAETAEQLNIPLASKVAAESESAGQPKP
jgi:hypothetical protein